MSGRLTSLILLAAALFVLAWYQGRGLVLALFGPPRVVLQEAYAGPSDSAAFDHSLWGRILKKHVDEDGFVDYGALVHDTTDLNRYIAALADAPFDGLGRNEKLALLLNAYNAFTLRLILDHYPVKSIKDIPEKKRWEFVHWKVGSSTWSLDQIEHEEIRPKFADPRIHFALVCAANGCPPLRREPYEGKRVDEQLEDQTKRINTDDRWIRFDPSTGDLHLTQLYEWYAGDFEQHDGDVLSFVSRYNKPLAAYLADGKEPAIHWLDYDWGLNDGVRRQASGK